jgi:hypothetical protein
MATITAENVLQLIDQMSLSEPLVVVAARLFQLIVGDALTRNPSNVDTISAASAPEGFIAAANFVSYRFVKRSLEVRNYVLPKMCQPGQ